MGEISAYKDVRRIKVLIAKSMIDAHDRGMKYLAKSFQEAGMEVILTNFETVEELVNTAVQEDVEVIGCSSLGGGHLALVSDLVSLLKEHETMSDVLIVVGGIIPSADIPKLLEMGVGRVFGPGTLPEKVINYVMEQVENRGLLLRR